MMVHNLLVGVEHIVVYLDDRGGDDDHSLEVLMPYVDIGLLTAIPWANKGQVSAYNDCMKRFSSQFQWLAMLDDDDIRALSNDTSASPPCLEEVLREGLVIHWSFYCTGRHILPHVKSIVRTDRAREFRSAHTAVYFPPYFAVDVHERRVDQPKAGVGGQEVTRGHSWHTSGPWTRSM